MSDPAHYETSEYYQPGFINEVGMGAAAVVAVVALFLLAIIGSRYLLLTGRRLGPRTRRTLRVLGGLARPSELVRREPRYRQPEPRDAHVPFKLKAAAHDAAAGHAASAAAGGRARTLAPLPAEAWPFYAEDEVAAAVDVLRSGKVNQWTGTKVFEFERAYAGHVGAGRAIGLANGSVALELALRAFGIGPGDEVIVTPRSFVASAFCVRLVGAAPVFADVDRDSGALTADTMAAAITPRTKAVIPVHLGGWPADIPAIAAIARKRNIRVIEDCAQAHGAEIDGRPVGSFGDAAAFSFCQDKIITTAGEGGLAVFRDEHAYERAWSFKDHGKDRSRALEPPLEPGFRWLHDSVGTNWRMTEIEAAIGLVQLAKLPDWRARRIANAGIWAEALRPVRGLRVPEPPPGVTGAYYKFYAYLDADPAENRRLRDAILAEAAAAGIRAFSGSCSEIYREAAFADMAIEPLPVAHELGEASLMFEVHPTLDPVRLHARAAAVAQIAREVLRG